jgi:hypothetical protein
MPYVDYGFPYPPGVALLFGKLLGLVHISSVDRQHSKREDAGGKSKMNVRVSRRGHCALDCWHRRKDPARLWNA